MREAISESLARRMENRERRVSSIIRILVKAAISAALIYVIARVIIVASCTPDAFAEVTFDFIKNLSARDNAKGWLIGTSAFSVSLLAVRRLLRKPVK